MRMMRKLFLFVLLLVSATTSFAQKSDSTEISDADLGLYPVWTFIVPGATHFYDGRIGTGIFFSVLEVGGITTGIVFNNALKAKSNSPYYNYPLFIGMNALAVDKCDFIRKEISFIKTYKPDFKWDDRPFNQIMMDPFKPKNFLAPITLAFVGLALGELYMESKIGARSINSVDQFSFMNTYIPRNKGMAVYGTMSMLMSWEAGVGEEFLFRNYLMPVWDMQWGPSKALWVTSGVFGAMHAANYLFVDKPDPWTIMYHVGFTTVMGYILGKGVQNNNYYIGKSVAAHTWYNFTLMLGSFLINPKDNIFGVDVKFKL